MAGSRPEGYIMGQALNELSGKRIKFFLNGDKSTFDNYPEYGLGIGETADNPTGEITQNLHLKVGFLKIGRDGTPRYLKDKTHTGNLKVNRDDAPGIQPTLKTFKPSVNISAKKG
ncbi:hypothetical protein [Chitinophaga silvisoli]|uniref:Uncharacterized protein n=1 Tax=Chitinophaga silvisoli TaxID=2291814 RepID=A0A3E1NMV3_9BACT|nr:hypothetical protein [Chitinophaga silvisoli]RFM29251.1 hypothetical protein DXN04_33755 [Chitinophaga silvisoli]